MDHDRLDGERTAAAADVEARLAALGRAERAAGPPGSHVARSVLARIEEPAVTDRMPLAATAAWRLASDLARPAFAATVVAVAAGAVAGTWLATAVVRAQAAAGEIVAETVTASNLDAAASAGFESGFLDADAPNGDGS